MSRNQRVWNPSIGVLAAVVGTVVLADGAQAAPRPASSKVTQARVFRGRGVPVPTRIGGSKAPAWNGTTSMSSPAKAKLLAALAKWLPAGTTYTPGTVYTQVSPGNPVAAGKMAMLMIRASMVNPSAGFATFPAFTSENIISNVDGRAGLWIKSEHAGARYLLDCAVTLYPGGNTKMRAMAEDGTIAYQFLSPGSRHVSWVMESPDAQWHSFQLAGSREFSIHACEATRL